MFETGLFVYGMHLCNYCGRWCGCDDLPPRRRCYRTPTGSSSSCGGGPPGRTPRPKGTTTRWTPPGTTPASLRSTSSAGASLAVEGTPGVGGGQPTPFQGVGGGRFLGSLATHMVEGMSRLTAGRGALGQPASQPAVFCLWWGPPWLATGPMGEGRAPPPREEPRAGPVAGAGRPPGAERVPQGTPPPPPHLPVRGVEFAGTLPLNSSSGFAFGSPQRRQSMPPLRTTPSPLSPPPTPIAHLLPPPPSCCQEPSVGMNPKQTNTFVARLSECVERRRGGGGARSSKVFL